MENEKYKNASNSPPGKPYKSFAYLLSDSNRHTMLYISDEWRNDIISPFIS